jgi:hypothetical protein
MNYKTKDMEALLLCYWRFSRGCDIVAVEFDYRAADIISYCAAEATVFETEIKISIADMKREARKQKHSFINKELWETPLKRRWWVNKFYFAVPVKIEKKAIELRDRLFPYAGLLVIDDYERYIQFNPRPYGPFPVREVKRASGVPAVEVGQETILELSKGMATSLSKTAYELMLARHELHHDEVEIPRGFRI